MGKVCKSCGHYYSGDYCDKCGYGKPEKVSAAAKKYRRAAKRKPERMQTEEDKKLYAKWAKEEKAEAAERRKDPKARQHFLIVVALATAIVVFIALYQSGAIFSNTREEVVEQYFNSISHGDFDKFVHCLPKEIKRDYESDRLDSGLSKEEYMKALYQDFTDKYGAGYSIIITYGNENQLDTADYNMEGYKAQYGTAPNLREVYEMVVNVEFRGTKATEQAKLYLYLGRTSGYWKIYGMTEDVGTQNEDGTPNEGELPPVVNEEEDFPAKE
ncbi:hypothetical protein [Ruminococcus sp.]|uniref:hypothetical protein n=1 Tax=Ruminococcus sp. TaxID=41978 RepID=UPI0025EB0877|nr:hypothetical protein [Ruminococcus sp.]MBQ8966295.1 hypothetical protein [Ruminococcus sp.]